MRERKPPDGALCARFLTALADLGNVDRAVAAVGGNRSNLYFWRRRDPDFARAWAEVSTRTLGRERKPRTVFTAIKQRIWLDSMAETGSVGRACIAAGVDRSTVYARRHHDAAFGADWAMARNRALDRVEDRLFDGALNGFVTEHSQGDIVRTRRTQRPDVMFRLLATRTGSGRSGGRLVELTPELIARARERLERQLSHVAAQAAAEARAAALTALPPPATETAR